MATSTTETTSQHATAQLRLWQLISPALPVGAYAYSQGLEYAVETGWVTDESSTCAWIIGVAQHSVGSLDIPILQRCYNAWQASDHAQVTQWNRQLQAMRESNELLMEDRQLASALRKVVKELQLPAPELVWQHQHWSFVTLYAWAASHWHIPLPDAARGLLWAWCENQVAAAIKLIPLGQSAGQRILDQCITRIPDIIDQASHITDDDIGATTPGLAIASALHETQYSRLFRS